METMEARALPRPLPRDFGVDETANATHGLRAVLGQEAWLQLPVAVRERFVEAGVPADYAGSFEVVRASRFGRAFAWIGRLLGTPVAPHVGNDVEAWVRVRAHRLGIAWLREYRWADGTRHTVESTKVITGDAKLTERLPARLCMPLHTYVAGGVLHFVSRGYYFDLGLGLKLWLPTMCTPGVTHVEHIDLGHGWFRFTMTVTHPLLGETFFQTGRFCAAEDCA
jgi:hypothetical protein